VVYRPARLTPDALESGYWHAYRSFYRWDSILRGAATKPTLAESIRHVAYAGGWKKLEPLWDLVIRAKRVSALLPVLETVLAGRLRGVNVQSEDADIALRRPEYAHLGGK
jgi:hypothetical protein